MKINQLIVIQNKKYKLKKNKFELIMEVNNKNLMSYFKGDRIFRKSDAGDGLTSFVMGIRSFGKDQ